MSRRGDHLMRAYVPRELVTQLDDRCARAGSISRGTALQAVWPQIMAAVDQYYRLTEAHRTRTGESFRT